MSKHIIFKIETNKLFRIFLNSEYSKFVIYNDLNIVLSSKRNDRTFKYNEISKISGETGICFSSVKIQTVYNEVFELPFLNKRKTLHADKWMNALLLCKKYKDIDSKIKGYFNSESYISYLQNSLFYEENINNNSRALSYRAEICKLFPNLKFDIEYPYLNSYLRNKDAERDKNNKKFLAEEPERNAVYFEGLNKKQIEAVITDEDNVLVVAGAGSGKTKVIEARIQYLIENKKTDPDNILVLTFNKEACAEVKKRVTKLLNTKIPHIKTFHGFGLSINRDSEKSLAPFCDDKNKYQSFVKEKIFEVLKKDKSNFPLFFLYFQSFYYKTKNIHDFKTKGEYDNYIHEQELLSLKNDKVKSFGELDIANFLFLHNVPYEYETEYKGNYQRDIHRREYKPDFYIPADENHKDIYIEYFGIDKDGNTANYIDSKKYNESIEWKRHIHKENNTILIELYSYDKFERNLIKKLKTELKAKKVDISHVLPPEKRFEILNNIKGIDNFTKLTAKFLKFYKGNNFKIAELILKLKEVKLLLYKSLGELNNKDEINNINFQINDIKRKQLFLKLFKPIYEGYQTCLEKNNQYDFEDMITTASEKLYKCYEVNKFDYKYILVDEFQDISRGRAEFLKKLISLNKTSKLFAVGDDWQAINRFAGSDISIMSNFSKEFEEQGKRGTSIITLNITYRFNDNISEVSSKFIQKNPDQIKKDIKANITSNRPAVLIWYDESEISAIEKILQQIYEFVANQKAKEKFSIMILTRYNLDKAENNYSKDLLKALKALKKEYNKIFNLSYSTIHASKGQGVDYVILLSLRQGAFPNTKEDDPIMELVMNNKDTFENAEERRLLYVALTRAKKEVYLVGTAKPSSFLLEIEDPKENYPVAICNRPDNYATIKCPECQTGIMIRPKNENNKFFYCQNDFCGLSAPVCPICEKGFLYNDNGLIKCSNDTCNHITKQCPECGGILVLRHKDDNYFYGCSNYRGQDEDISCKYTKRYVCIGCKDKKACIYKQMDSKTNELLIKCTNEHCNKTKNFPENF